MHLRQSEVIRYTIYRHKTPYLVRIFLLTVAALPVYLAVIAIGKALSDKALTIGLLIVSFFFGIILILYSVNYLLDKLIITNQRIIFVDWRSIFTRVEFEAKFSEVQDIKTRETGIFARLHIFDFGLLNIETAASKTTIMFVDCPDPEGVKHKIFGELQKAGYNAHA